MAMWALLVLWCVVVSHGVEGWPGTTADAITAQPSCRYNCGYSLGSCSCSSSCQYYGNCCYDYNTHCQSTTMPPRPPTSAGPSCRYNCGYNLGSCSCSSSCQYYGNCCYDYNTHCQATTARPQPTGTAQPSCRYNCGYNLGSCSCSSSCQYYGNCCYDYNTHCKSTTESPTSGQPSCRYNCGYNLGSCSCSSSCQYYGNCCYDYNTHCQATTAGPQPTVEPTGQPSCRYNCGYNLGSCSCSSSCQYYGNCCNDYNTHCQSTTERPQPPTQYTSGQPSCRYNCGNNLGSCSCSSSCQYYGNCCYDYNTHCQSTTERPQPPTSAQYCGGSLYGNGTFSSPNYPNEYYNNANCVWHLTANYRQTVSLSFTDLQLENCCTCDWIDIYDGPSVYYPYLGKVCYPQNNLTIQSSSQYMTVVFRTDGSVLGRGFKAEFTSVSQPISKGRVDCSSGRMNIVIERSYLNSVGYNDHSLYLNDQYCRPRVYRNQVVFDFPLNTCGTELKVENGAKMVYTNAVRAYKSSYGEVTRQSYFKLNVTCVMEQEMMVQTAYKIHEQINGNLNGIGRFNGSMAFYRSFNSSDQVTEFPYKVALNENVYVQVNLISGNDTGLVIFPYTCVASPSPHDFQSRSYDLVRNGCARDNTYHDYTAGSRGFARFTFKSFKFLRAHEMVYLQCKVLICPASDHNSRCRRGCRSRVTRDLGLDHDSHTMVLGPFQMKDIEQDGGSKVEIKA